jgi:hypothetical protein
MTDEGNTHFGSDEERLSAYVLGRLEESERLAMERHAATCSSCSEALRREMILAAGTRKLGREELKAELRRKIALSREPARFPLAWSAAAALFLVAGLGVYYALFTGGEKISPPSVGTPPLAMRAERSAQSAPGSPGGGEKILMDKGAASTAQGAAGAEEKQKTSPIALKGSMEDERRSEPARELPAAPTVVGGAAVEEGFWSDGIVETAVQAHGAPRAVVTQAEKSLAVSGANDARSDRAQAREESNRLRGAALQLKKDASGGRQGEFLIRQQSANTLPGERDQLRKAQNAVPTRFDQRGSTTTMTMYLDSLVDEKELQNASVEAVRDDSVIVTLGGKRILYHLAPGQGGAGARQK